LEFRSSEIAAAVAISLKELPAQEVDKAITDFFIVDKVRLCVVPGNGFPSMQLQISTIQSKLMVEIVNCVI
jgi:hypothetical protein